MKLDRPTFRTKLQNNRPARCRRAGWTRTGLRDRFETTTWLTNFQFGKITCGSKGIEFVKVLVDDFGSKGLIDDLGSLLPTKTLIAGLSGNSGHVLVTFNTELYSVKRI